MSFIQVRDLSHGYTAGGFFSKRHRVHVLDGLNLDLEQGQSLALQRLRAHRARRAARRLWPCSPRW